MTVFSGKQVFPVDYEAEVSQRLLEASLSGDLKSALECIADPFVDVNFVGAVCLKTKKTEVLLRDESASEVRVDYEEFKTDVTALFLAVHAGNVALVKKLLVMWLRLWFWFVFCQITAVEVEIWNVLYTLLILHRFWKHFVLELI